MRLTPSALAAASLSLARPARISPVTFALRCFISSVRFARRWPEMEAVYYRSAYEFLKERIRLEEGAR